MMRQLWQRVIRNWPAKLGALALAIFVWTFVVNNDESTTQRSLLVPITVEGIATNEVVVGLADVVEVTVSGPSTQVERLDPDGITARLDLSGIDGDFREQIDVDTPRGIRTQRVEPTSLQGLVTSVTSRAVPIQAVELGRASSDRRMVATVDPALGGSITVRARREVLETVDRVLVGVPVADLDDAPRTLDLRPFAVDPDGEPVRDTQITPERVTVTASLSELLARGTVPITLARDGLQVELERTTIAVAAPPSVLAGLATVRARVDADTSQLEPGRYTLPLALEVPAGVVAGPAPRATVTIPEPANRGSPLP